MFTIEVILLSTTSPYRDYDKMPTLEIRFMLKLMLLANHTVFRYSPFDNSYKPFENTSLTLVLGMDFFPYKLIFKSRKCDGQISGEIADSRTIPVPGSLTGS